MWINTGHFQHTAHASIWLFLRANLKVFFPPTPDLEQLPTAGSTSLQQWKTVLSLQSDQFLKNPFRNWWRVSRVLHFYFLLTTLNKMVPLRKASLKANRRAAASLSCSSWHYLQQAILPKCLLSAAGGWCADTCAPAHRAQTEASDRQAETEFTFLGADTEGEKVTANHKVTSAQWRDEGFGVLNSLVFPKCLI